MKLVDDLEVLACVDLVRGQDAITDKRDWNAQIEDCSAHDHFCGTRSLPDARIRANPKVDVDLFSARSPWRSRSPGINTGMAR